MGMTLQLENTSASSTVDLTSVSGIAVVDYEITRDLSYHAHGEAIIKSYTFRATGTTKAAARTAVNTFVGLLRDGVEWNEDTLKDEATFLREANDGETSLRMLLINYEVKAIPQNASSGQLGSHQSHAKDIFFVVAFTLQNHRELSSQTTLTFPYETNAYSSGFSITTRGAETTKESRVALQISSTETSGNRQTRLWIGFKADSDYPTTEFQPVWLCDHASSLGTDTTETTSAGSQGTNIAKVSFTTDESMKPRIYMNVNDAYDGLGRAESTYHARGRWATLIRYKVDSGSNGNIFCRIGTAPDVAKSTYSVAYNEPRLLDNSGAWRFMEGGVVTIPPQGYREATSSSTIIIDKAYVVIDCQRIGAGADRTVVIDSVTFIPYDHYIRLSNLYLDENYNVNVVTNEDLSVEAFVSTVGGGTSFFQRATILEINNFMYPISIPTGSGTFSARMVIASEQEGAQVYDDNLDYSFVKVYKAFEAYNV